MILSFPEQSLPRVKKEYKKKTYPQSDHLLFFLVSIVWQAT